MKKVKSLVALSLALCMVLCFAGCSSNNDEGSLKDNLVNGFNTVSYTHLDVYKRQVYTVEGNSGDACRQNSYAIGSRVIYGYGIPAY